ncbi:MAG TPA: hypothetical protein VKZ53_04255 [Candidatus Angelobacter sp.]|nr:hypothetical protein [Candidatus Angelobacter sp.]
MKRMLQRVLFVILVFAELWLLTGFLPQRWQENMYAGLSKARPSQSYDYSRITHPNLDVELRPFEPWSMALLVVLVVVNGGAIVALWRRRNT